MSKLLIKNGLLVTMNDKAEIVQGDMLIEDGIIKEVGKTVATADQVIDANGQWVLPGFVQTHVHLCQVSMRGLADNMNVVDWLRERIWPLENAHDSESLYQSAQLGIAELLKGGTTSVLTMETTNYTDAVFQAVSDSGIRAAVGKAILDYKEAGTEMDAENTDESLAEIYRLIERWHGADNGRIRYALCPRGPRNCTDKMMSEIAILSDKYNLIIHSHAAENCSLTRSVVEKTGIRDIQLFDQWGCTGRNLVLAHCIWIDESEMRILQETGSNVAHCPSANMKLASGFAKIPEMVGMGINVSLGADGAPCNNNLSAFQEMRLASLIHRPRCGELALPAEEILYMATRGGAKALGLENEIGMLKPGFRADVILLKRDGVHASPYSKVSPASQIVYSLNSQDVSTTIVDGKVLVRNGELSNVREQEMIEKANRSMEEMIKRAGLEEQFDLSLRTVS